MNIYRVKTTFVNNSMKHVTRSVGTFSSESSSTIAAQSAAEVLISEFKSDIRVKSEFAIYKLFDHKDQLAELQIMNLQLMDVEGRVEIEIEQLLD